ncbi:MAG: carbohydrate-binding domain-containing protein [Ruminococcaceae bacterium]|nr:carbohydrate-binding domain-containing protein [Oscillospiraceae bacterium]
MKRLFALFLTFSLLLSGCSYDQERKTGITEIKLSDSKITVDGKEITNDKTQAVYSDKDIVFYLAGQGFTYGEGEEKDEHEQSEADAHTVVHITKPGRYVLSGELSLGQIAVDLGEDAKTDPDAVVTLILNGVDVSCKVAPAIIFYNVYECSSSDEEGATKDVDTSKAGANVIIADGSENNVNGSYVARIYKSYELSEDGTEVVDNKKLHKYDGALYSKMTMNVGGGDKGDGILNINAENEGLNSELHLTINGGVINITSGNDGINTNEDNVSVTTINGGRVNILCDGSTGEGDGIDSNGWLVINGGTVIAQACATSGDAGIDSDKGIYINGGRVIASGNMLDRIAGGEQTYAVFKFSLPQSGSNTYTLKDSLGKTVGVYAPENSFSYLIVAGDELTPGTYTFWQGETQLSSSQGKNMQDRVPQWERPDSQNGDGQGKERPFDFSEDIEIEEIPFGERPQGEKPEFPFGEPPEMSSDLTPPDNKGENMTVRGDTSTDFIIIKGGNQFFNVGPVA